MDWEDVPRTVDEWTELTAAPAWDVKRAAANVYTDTDVGYYYHPIADRIALYAPQASRQDMAICKAAAERAVGTDRVAEPFLSYQDLADPDCGWVKVAYSTALRRIGELLNFFPGQYPGGIPNAPSPLAAMLTSGLVGAGLGYGAGQLASRVLPTGFGRKLKRTGAVLGGAIGTLPALAWGASSPYGWTDPRPLDPEPGSDPDYSFDEKTAAALASIPVSPQYKQALDAFGYGLGYRTDYDRRTRVGSVYPSDVNINALGRTLWDTGAPPEMAAMTMGAMYAAQQLPDRRAQPGIATGHQLGQLAANAAGDYASGWLVGAALNTLVGTPYAASSYGLGNAALGVIGAVVPKLFGR